MNYEGWYLPVREIVAAKEAGLLSPEEATLIVRSYFPQLAELDRAKAHVAAHTKESA